MVRTIRGTRLSRAEKDRLCSEAAYEGSPFHKRNPGDFGLTPPSLPRLDKTLCDEAKVFDKSTASALFSKAIARGIVSEATTAEGFPKQLWAVDENGQVFEAIYGGSRTGRYHGYPIRRADPFFVEISKTWMED